MLKRIRPRINSAHVIATIALFAALGGGYAMAFSGSGSLQKAGLSGVPYPGPPGGFTTVRSLTGIGSIQAICSGGTAPGVYFRNTSGEELAIRGVSGDHSTGDTARFFGVTVGSGSNPLAIPIHGGEFIGHIAPTDGSKAPQVNLQVSAIGVESCANARINVLALNTQE